MGRYGFSHRSDARLRKRLALLVFVGASSALCASVAHADGPAEPVCAPLSSLPFEQVTRAADGVPGAHGHIGRNGRSGSSGKTGASSSLCVTASAAGEATLLHIVSTGGDGGNGGTASRTGHHGGHGGHGGQGGDLTLTLAEGGALSTSGDGAHAVHLVSRGGHGGHAGGGGSGSGADGGDGGNGGLITLTSGSDITTTGVLADAIRAESVGGEGGKGARSGWFSSTGGDGGAGGFGGGHVDIDASGHLSTSGAGAAGIHALSVGGDGGDGGASTGLFYAVGGNGGRGGRGGDVEIDFSGTLSTLGQGADAILAQSIGGGGGRGGLALSAGVIASLAVGGTGGDGGDARAVSVKLTDGAGVATEGRHAAGVRAQSIGGGGGTGGGAGGVAVGAVGVSVSVGGSGGEGGDASTVHFELDETASVETGLDGGGALADAVVLQSIGGGGGHGGASVAVGAGFNPDGAGVGVSLAFGGHGGKGGDGGEVTAEVHGDLTTHGDLAAGLRAQSIGGGGGAGGNTVSVAVGAGEVGASVSLALGGRGGSGGHAGHVGLRLDGDIRATGQRSEGFVAQSIGGGGGAGGNAVSVAVSAGETAYTAGVSVGGSGGSGGNAGGIVITQAGMISTEGDHAAGGLVQALGGGGGTGGNAYTFTLAAGSGQGEDGGKAENVNVSVGGGGGGGGRGGAITYTQSGAIDTLGIQSHALMLQSIGGGGGSGGHALSVSANLVSGASGGDEASSRQLTLAVGGRGGDGDTGGDIRFTTALGAAMTTAGSFSHGLFAQSIGGGGGDGGYAESVNLSKETSGGEDGGDGGSATVRALDIGGAGGHGGSGGTVDIQLDAGMRISTTGHGANAVFAQSIGGGGGHGGHAHAYGKISGANEDDTTDSRQSIGGAGGSGNHGGAVVLTDAAAGSGALQTSGEGATGLLAQSIGGGGGAAGTTSSALEFYGQDFAEMDIPSGGGDDEGEDSEGGESGEEGSEAPEGQDPPELQLIGGGAGAAGDGGAVTVTRLNPVTTLGDAAIGVHAQSIGAGGGLLHHGGVSGSLDGHHFRLGGSSRANGQGGVVTLALGGLVSTEGAQAHAVSGQSIGGGGGSSALTATGGVGALSLDGRLGGESGVGDGGAAGLSHDGRLQTAGVQAITAMIQSVGGGGGDMRYGAAYARSADVTLRLGGVDQARGDGRAASLSGAGDFITAGDQAFGALVQSVGAGGGLASLAGFTLQQDFNAAFHLGGAHHVAGGGGAVTIDLPGAITTSGVQAAGLVAQSAGAGGGVLGIGDIQARDSVFGLHLGAEVGGAGNGGPVTLAYAGHLETHGLQAHGVIAQSIAGGGGIASVAAADTAHITLGADAGQQGNAGAIAVTLDGSVLTHGEQSFGIIAQSVSGGGGLINLAGVTAPQRAVQQVYRGSGRGGAVSVVLASGSSVATEGDGAAAVVAQSAVSGGILVAAAGLDGTSAPYRLEGHGGAVSVTADGLITTRGDAASGIVAAASGGAELLAFSLDGLERRGQQGYGPSGQVAVTVGGAITTEGRGSHGVDAYATSYTERAVWIDVSGLVTVTGDESVGLRATNTRLGLDSPNLIGSRLTTEIHIGQGAAVSAAGARAAIEIEDTIGHFDLRVDGSVVSRNDVSSHASRAVSVVGSGHINIGEDGLVFGAVENNGDWAVDLANEGIFDGFASGIHLYDLREGGRHYLPVSGGLDAPALDLFQIGDHEGELRPYLSDFAPVGSIVLISSEQALPEDILGSIANPAATAFSFAQDQADGVSRVLITGASVDFTDLVTGASRPAAELADETVAAWLAGDTVDDGDAPYYQQLLYAARLETAEDVASYFDGRFSYVESHRAGAAHHASAVAHLNSVHSCGQPSGRWAAIAEAECIWINGASHYAEDDRAGARQNAYGFSFGRQAALSPTLRLGFGAGYGVDLIKTGVSRSEGEQANLAAVLKRVEGPRLLSASAALSYSQADTMRTETAPGGAIETLTSEQDTIGLSARLRAARLLEAGPLHIIPLVDLDLSYLHDFGYDEQGGAAALSVHASDQMLVDLHPAVRFGGDVAAGGIILRPYAAVGARFALNHAEMTQSLQAGGVFSGRPVTYEVARDDVRGVAELGLRAFSGERWEASFYIEHSEGDQTRRQSASAKLAMRF